MRLPDLRPRLQNAGGGAQRVRPAHPADEARAQAWAIGPKRSSRTPGSEWVCGTSPGGQTPAHQTPRACRLLRTSPTSVREGRIWATNCPRAGTVARRPKQRRDRYLRRRAAMLEQGRSSEGLPGDPIAQTATGAAGDNRRMSCAGPGADAGLTGQAGTFRFARADRGLPSFCLQRSGCVQSGDAVLVLLRDRRLAVTAAESPPLSLSPARAGAKARTAAPARCGRPIFADGAQHGGRLSRTGGPRRPARRVGRRIVMAVSRQGDAVRCCDRS
jgi:hypothetical protein